MSETVTKEEALTHVKPGDIIGFAGKGFASRVIRSASVVSRQTRYRNTWSHVGIVSSTPKVLIESTTKNTAPDLRSGSLRYGVSEVNLATRLESFNGRLFIRPLKFRLSLEERRAFTEYFVRNIMGRSYESLKTMGGLWNLIDAELFDWVNVGSEERESGRLFCSELVANMVELIDFIHTSHHLPGGRLPSQYSPTDCRYDWPWLYDEAVEILCEQ